MSQLVLQVYRNQPGGAQSFAIAHSWGFALIWAPPTHPLEAEQTSFAMLKYATIRIKLLGLQEHWKSTPNKEMD